MSLQSILDTGVIGLESRILRYDVDFPTEGGAYQAPPFFGSDIPELSNEQDITAMVFSYEQDFSDQSIVQSARLHLFVEWADHAYRELLRPNDYVIIQERYRDEEANLDSGWLDKGHYLVHGSSDDIQGPDGRTLITIELSDTLKLLTIEKFTGEVGPDLLLVPRTKAILTNSGTVAADGYYKFQVETYTGSGVYYENWSADRMVKIWLVYGSSHPDHPGEELQLRSGNGSIQIVGGDGAVLFDKEYFEDTWDNEGLDSPAEIHLSFWRYATEADEAVKIVDSAQDADTGIAQIGYIDVTVGFAAGASNLAKSVWVNSGNATGRQYKVALDPYSISSAYPAAVAGEAGTGWTFDQPIPIFPPVAQPSTQDDDDHFAESGSGNHNWGKFNHFGIISGEVADGDEVIGLEIQVLKAKVTGNSNARVEVAFSLDGGTTPSPRLIELEGLNSTETDYGALGGVHNLFGLAPTPAQIRNNNFTVMVRLHSGSGGNLLIDQILVRIFVRRAGAVTTTTRLVLTGPDGGPAYPVTDGVLPGDTITIGDANLHSKAFEKVLRLVGFQTSDATKPFYIDEIQDSSFGPIRVPPMTNRIEDERPHIELLEAIMNSFTTPNFQIWQGLDGKVRGQEIVQKASPDYVLERVSSRSLQTTDEDIYTKVIARGVRPANYNVASNKFGSVAGTYVSRSYYKQANVSQLIDDDVRTPKIGGVIYQNRPSKWNFGEDTDFCWIDLGQDRTIEQLEFVFAVFTPGASNRAQIFRIMYMSEADYTNAGHGSPQPPGDDPPPADSIGWRFLIDDFKCEDGVVAIPSSEWTSKVETTMRWIKIVVPQWYVYATVKTSKKSASIRLTSQIVLSEFRAIEFHEIRMSAEIGVDPFNTVELIALQNRLRRRTFLAPEPVPYLNTEDKVLTMAILILRERYRNFAPVSVIAVRPDCEIRQTVTLIDPGDGSELSYLVEQLSRSVTVSEAFSIRAVLVNYLEEGE